MRLLPMSFCSFFFLKEQATVTKKVILVSLVSHWKQFNAFYIVPLMPLEQNLQTDGHRLSGLRGLSHCTSAMHQWNKIDARTP